MICGPNISDLISEIYSNIHMGAQLEDHFFLKRNILCPRNAEVNEINSLLYSQFPGQGRIYYSADCAKGQEVDLYPVEFGGSVPYG